MPDYAFSTFTFLGILLCAAPAYFNWKIPGRPWATLILIGWIFFGNLVSFIDSVVWSNPDPNEWWDGQGYCDIAARIKASYNIGIPAAAIGICRFLADATDPDPSQKDLKHSRTRRNLIDVFLGIGLPVINMPLRWIAQPYRYYILGVMGCENGLDYTWPAIPLYLLWSPVLTLVAAVYAGLSSSSHLLTLGIFLRHWWIRRKRLNESWALGMRNGISQTEFRRLVVTVMCVIFLYFPLSLYFLVVNVRIVLQAQQPFIWSVDHGPQSGLIIKLPHETADLISWVAPVLAITSFFFIGTTRNARQFYQRCVESVYDHLPSKLQSKLSAMQKISEASKERRLAQSSLTAGEGRSNVSMVERYHPQSKVLTTVNQTYLTEEASRIGSILMTTMPTIPSLCIQARLRLQATKKWAVRGMVHCIISHQLPRYPLVRVLGLNGPTGLVSHEMLLWRRVLVRFSSVQTFVVG
jgi:hypothetical protein